MFNIERLLTAPLQPFLGSGKSHGCSNDSGSAVKDAFLSGVREGMRFASKNDDSCGESRRDRGCSENGGHRSNRGDYGSWNEYGNDRRQGHGNNGGGNHRGCDDAGNGYGHGGSSAYGNDRYRRDDECGYGSSSGVNGGSHGSNNSGRLTGGKEGDVGVATTAGGYKIRATPGDEGKLEITSPNGEKTEISGDPHVYDVQSNGSKDVEFDYKKGGFTIKLGDGTKIETDTTKLANGTTVLKSASVIDERRGDVGVRFSGLSEGKDKFQVNVGVGSRLDDQIEDGVSVFWDRAGDGEFSALNDFGGTDQRVDQAWIDAQEAKGRGNDHSGHNHGGYGGFGNYQPRYVQAMA